MIKLGPGPKLRSSFCFAGCYDVIPLRCYSGRRRIRCHAEPFAVMLISRWREKHLSSSAQGKLCEAPALVRFWHLKFEVANCDLRFVGLSWRYAQGLLA